MNLNLTNEEQLLVNSEVQKSGKNMAIAYVFWIFLGGFGAHRFYLRKKGSAIAQLILTLTLFGAIISGVWLIVDLFLIPGITREINNNIENRAAEQILNKRNII
ncbi:hypothetical protein GCM10011391_32850 [Pullulanibacillus camelliae]|uniref:TM2 domain-containing protein n=1 Tax=Pullulanibacillus camelliae TaxID=1707096 RepID=A0A8J2YLU2_9BACL|nr:TM2 domain-containing protein [Pullulanibacillus camelliae]GGE51488.1 hypothetical protein GCM10011391_32850 [Pullulanibacillus camelliae]